MSLKIAYLGILFFYPEKCLSIKKEICVRCKPDSVLRKNRMGNHLSVRPEPGADNAVERRLALYLVLLREEFTLTTALSQTRPVGSYPTISTLPHPGGCLAVYFLLHLSFRGL